MLDREIQLLSFDEDEFDLEEYQKTAGARTRIVIRTQRLRRRIVVYRMLIMLLAFVIAYGLYNMASELILRYDYLKHHTMEYTD